MKLESLVIADQNAAVNTFSGLVHTARHTMEASYIKSNFSNSLEKKIIEILFITGVKS